MPKDVETVTLVIPGVPAKMAELIEGYGMIWGYSPEWAAQFLLMRGVDDLIRNESMRKSIESMKLAKQAVGPKPPPPPKPPRGY